MRAPSVWNDCFKQRTNLTLRIFSAAGFAFFILDIIPPTFSDEIFVALNITNVSLSVATTLLCSLIIVVRIFLVSRMPGTTHQPIKAAEIVIESAAFYSITALIWIALPYASTLTYNLYVDVFYTIATVCGPISLFLHC
jgi:hypothetical protein